MWSLKVIGLKLKSVSCPQGFIHRVPKLTSTFLPCDPKSIGLLFSSSTTCMWSLIVIRQKLQSVFCPHGFIHRTPKLTLTFAWPKINRVPLLVIHNWHVKFESDQTKTVVCFLPMRFHTQSNKVDLDHWPHNLERDRTKSVVCIVPIKFYTQSAKVDLDLWPCDPKSIGFLFSSSTTYMWSLKVIGLKLKSLSCPQGSIQSTKVDLERWPCDPKSIGFLFSLSTSYIEVGK